MQRIDFLRFIIKHGMKSESVNRFISNLHFYKTKSEQQMTLFNKLKRRKIRFFSAIRIRLKQMYKWTKKDRSHL
jgi:hypothetical protein